MAAYNRLAVLQRHITGQQIDGSVALAPTAAVNREGLLQDQVAIITGSGQGVGEACAKLFASEGACVVVSDLDAAKSDKVAADIVSGGGRAVSVPGDVTAEHFGKAVVEAAIAEFGRVDILVNNAGYTWDAVIHKMTSKQWEAMFAVHCTAPFRLIQAATPYMRDAAKKEMDTNDSNKPSSQRVILNVSSTSGVHGNAGQANYSTCKMGVVGLTKTVAKEWGPYGIRCNALVFGTIKTRLTGAKDGSEAMSLPSGEKVVLGIPGGMDPDALASMNNTPLGRAGTVEEAAGAILMLASKHAGYITGHALEVTGGAYL